jgi:hypothetical protein
MTNPPGRRGAAGLLAKHLNQTLIIDRMLGVPLFSNSRR